MHKPVILFDLKHLNRVINLLLGRSEEATESVNELVANRTRAQVMSFVLHGCDLHPLILLDDIFLNGVKSLFAAEATKHENITFAHSDCMGISGLVHWLFVDHFIFLEQVDSGVFLGRRTTASDKNLG